MRPRPCSPMQFSDRALGEHGISEVDDQADDSSFTRVLFIACGRHGFECDLRGRSRCDQCWLNLVNLLAISTIGRSVAVYQS